MGSQNCPAPVSTLARSLGDSSVRTVVLSEAAELTGAALADYNQAIALDPCVGAAYHNRGLVHYHAGAYHQALADYNRALDLAPDDAEAYVNRGLLHEARGDGARLQA